jgi:Family of unknown function (DUF6370)
MKKTAILSALIASLLSLGASAGESTLSGEAVCAKCNLKKTETCQMAVKVKEQSGKEDVILAENNAVAKDFHSEICKASAKVNVTGVVTEKDGKKTIVLSKVEVAK